MSDDLFVQLECLVNKHLGVITHFKHREVDLNFASSYVKIAGQPELWRHVALIVDGPTKGFWLDSKRIEDDPSCTAPPTIVVCV